MKFIRQGATHKVCIGPVVAVGDGFTPVTTLSLASADEAEALVHDSGTVVDISGYTFAAVTTMDGYYNLTLQSGISNTVGHVTIAINDDSLCLPVKAEFTVVEEAVYDALFAASAAGYQVPIWAAANSTVNLSATTIKTATDVEADTADIQSRLPAALTANGNMKSDVLRWNGSTTEITNFSEVFNTAYATAFNNLDGRWFADCMALNGNTTSIANLNVVYTTDFATNYSTTNDAWVVRISSGTGTGQVSLSSGAVLLQATQTGVTIPTVTTLTNDPSGVTTLLSRLSATRAGYLDNLSAGAVATASALTSLAGKFTGITSLAQWLGLMFGKQTPDSTALTEIRATGAGSGTGDPTTDSSEAIRDRGDAAWTTGGGGSITDSLNVQPLIPNAIDVADTAVYRLGLMLFNALDDLPSTAEITPGTISIDRKAQGGTSWTSVVADAACSESAGLIYYDEVFDSATGYVAGDQLRITFKSQKITVSANDFEITDSTGRIFYTGIRLDGAIYTDTQAIDAELQDPEAFGDLMDAQGYTSARAALVDNMDAAITTRQAVIWAATSSTVNLSNTTIKTVTDVETDTQNIQSRLPAALVGGKMDSNASVTLSQDDIDAIVAGVAAEVQPFPLTGDPLTNFTVFFTNSDVLTTKTIDNVTTPTNVEVQIGA